MRRVFYRRYYEPAVRAGLVLAVWFAASARAAHDYWSASVLFAWTTALACAFCLGRALDEKPVKLPLLIPVSVFLAATALSFTGTYDRNSTLFEAWIWAFSFLLALLFVNVVETPGQAEVTLTACSAGLIPLAAEMASKTALGSELRKALVVPNVWAQLALVGFLLSLFYAALYYFVRVIERKNAARAAAALAAFAFVHAGLLLFSERIMLTEDATPLINHNVLVGFTMYWFFILWKKTMEKTAWLALMLPCLFLLIVERSWWSYVVLLAGFLVYYRAHFAERIREHRAAFAAVGGAALAVLALIVVVKASQHVPTILGISRVLWWGAAARMIARHPFTGVGLGGFSAAYPFFKIGHVDNTIHGHSFPLQLLAETGLAGGAAAVWLIASFRRLASGPGGDPPPRRAALATLTAVLGFAAIHINLEYFLNKFVLLFFLASLLAGRSVPARRIKPLALACASACLLLLAPFWLRLYSSSRLYMAGRASQESGDLARAEALYKDALDVDPTNADSDWALAELEREKFQATASPRARQDALNYYREGLRQKKDFLLLKRLTTPAP
jgi:O-antigen ligase